MGLIDCDSPHVWQCIRYEYSSQYKPWMEIEKKALVSMAYIKAIQRIKG